MIEKQVTYQFAGSGVDTQGARGKEKVANLDSLVVWADSGGSICIVRYRGQRRLSHRLCKLTGGRDEGQRHSAGENEV